MHIIYRLFIPLTRSRLFWRLISPMIKFFKGIESIRQANVRKCILSKSGISEMLDNEVQHGPFKGLKYPELIQNGRFFQLPFLWDSIFPKLAGTYECELHDTIRSWTSKEYSKIINIGCAEGYYSVGLARIFPKSQIIAYDTDPEARRLCAELMSLNGCDKQLTMAAECNPADLATLDFGERSFVICDCEGCEKKLFTEHNIKHLSKCDLIIEIHDHLDTTINEYLIRLFSPSHDILLVNSLSNYQKLRNHRSRWSMIKDDEELLALVSENRDEQQEWLVCEARQ